MSFKKRKNILGIGFVLLFILSLSFVLGVNYGEEFNSFERWDNGGAQDNFFPQIRQSTDGRFVSERVSSFDSIYDRRLSSEKIISIHDKKTPFNLEQFRTSRLFDSEYQRLFDLEYKGFIIEFEDKPILKYKSELEKRAEENQEYIERAFILNPKKVYIQIFDITLEKVEGRIDRYQSNLEVKNNKIKNEIATKIGNQEKITNEFKDLFNGVVLDISYLGAKEIEEIEKIEGVKKVWPNMKVEALLNESVPLIGANQVWSLNAQGGICLRIAEKGVPIEQEGPCLTGKGIKIAIIDTGVDYIHGDLGGCYGSGCKVIGGYDIVNQDNDPMDDHGHGTHVAATAAGNGILKGVAPDAKIYAYKVLDSGGSGTMSGVIAGIEIAVDPNQDGNFSDKVDIISMSLGGWGNPDDPVSQATDNAVELGAVVVVAAGNAGPSEQTIGSPATARKAITVGASDKQDELAWFSSRGPVIWEDENGNENYLIKPDVVAPGVNICAAQASDDKIWQMIWDWYGINVSCLDDEHISISGTSMATPHVAGAVALLKQKNPGWSPDEIKMALRNTAIDLNYGITEQGRGRIDVVKAIKLKDKLPIAELSAKIENNKIKLFGTAYSNNFSYFKIYRSYENEDFEEIYYSTSSIHDGFLYEIDLQALRDGKNTFRLDVSSQDGRISSDFVLIDVENIKIKSLFTNDIYRRGDLIPIKANISYDDYNYTIYWSKQYEDNWSDEGIIISNNTGDLIAEWDTGLLPQDAFYQIKIIFDVLNVGIIEKKIEMIYFDSSLKQGWPQKVEWDYVCEGQQQQFCYHIWPGRLVPVVEDLESDGYKEILFFKGGDPPKIIGYSYNGSLFLEKNIGSNSRAGMRLANLAVDDINNDGVKEIVVANWDFSTTFYPFYSIVYLIDKYGNTLWSVKLLEGQDVISIVIDDLDNDGNKEIIVKTHAFFSDPSGAIDTVNSTITIINSSGYISKQWIIPQDLGKSGLAVGNLDSDPEKEIVLADVSARTHTENEGVIFVYNLDGTLVDGWPVFTPGMIWSSPVIGDINNDDNNEIIVGLIYFGNPSPSLGGVYAFLKNGTLVEGWPFGIGHKFSYNPAIGDLDEDEFLEIVISEYLGGVNILRHNGTLVDGWPRGDGRICSSSSLADIDNNGISEIFTPCGDKVYGWRLNGILLKEFPKKIHQIYVGSSPTIQDIDNDGDPELIATSNWRGGVGGDGIFVWELNNVSSFNYEWPMERFNAQHTGCYDCDKIYNQSQSKITNNMNIDIDSRISMYIQKKVGGNWNNYRNVVLNESITIPAKSSFDLKSLFNSRNVIINEQGNYRVYSVFEVQGEKIESFEEFSVGFVAELPRLTD